MTGEPRTAATELNGLLEPAVPATPPPEDTPSADAPSPRPSGDALWDLALATLAESDTHPFLSPEYMRLGGDARELLVKAHRALEATNPQKAALAEKYAADIDLFLSQPWPENPDEVETDLNSPDAPSGVIPVLRAESAAEQMERPRTWGASLRGGNVTGNWWARWPNPLDIDAYYAGPFDTEAEAWAAMPTWATDPTDKAGWGKTGMTFQEEEGYDPYAH